MWLFNAAFCKQVILSPSLHRRVDDHLGKYLSQKTKSIDDSRDILFPNAIDSDGIANNGPVEAKESFSKNKGVSDNALWRKSMQLNLEQQAWQVS